jgi:hypothetical protein
MLVMPGNGQVPDDLFCLTHKGPIYLECLFRVRLGHLEEVFSAKLATEVRVISCSMAYRGR